MDMNMMRRGGVSSLHISHRTSSTRCSSPSSVCNVYPPCFYSSSSGGFSPARGCGFGGCCSGYPSNVDGTPKPNAQGTRKCLFTSPQPPSVQPKFTTRTQQREKKRDTGDNIISASVCVFYSDLSPHITSPVPPPPPFFSPLSPGSPDRCVATLPS